MTPWLKCSRCREMNPEADLDDELVCVDCRDVEAFILNAGYANRDATTPATGDTIGTVTPPDLRSEDTPGH